MIITEPTYEKVLPLLGRHVTVKNYTGRLAAVLLNCSDTMYIGIDTAEPNRGESAAIYKNVRDRTKSAYVGPKDIKCRWVSDFELTVHDPIKDFSPPTRLWWLATIPLVVGALSR